LAERQSNFQADYDSDMYFKGLEQAAISPVGGFVKNFDISTGQVLGSPHNRDGRNKPRERSARLSTKAQAYGE
jgi:hypothetical protein